jgi:hypothetical protein
VTAGGCGRSSGVEHNLAKVGVEGSNPFARSNNRTAQKPRKTAAFRVVARSKTRNFGGDGKGARLPLGYKSSAAVSEDSGSKRCGDYGKGNRG